MEYLFKIDDIKFTPVITKCDDCSFIRISNFEICEFVVKTQYTVVFDDLSDKVYYKLGGIVAESHEYSFKQKILDI